MAGIVGNTFAFIPIRVVDVESPDAFQHRVDSSANLDPGCYEHALQVVVVGGGHSERNVVQHAFRLLARKAPCGVRMRDQHDHLRHSVRPGPRAEELVRQLGGRDHLQPEQIAVEM